MSLDMGHLFSVGSVVLLSMVVQQLAVILVLLQEEMSARPSVPESLFRSVLIPTAVYTESLEVRDCQGPSVLLLHIMLAALGVCLSI